MLHRIAFISRVPLEVSEDKPRPDAVELAKRISAESFSPGRIDSTYALSRYFSSSKSLTVNAAMAAYIGKNYDLLLISGEDIGYRTALLAKLTRLNIPILICFHGHAVGSRKNSFFMHMLSQQLNVHWLCLSSSIAAQLVSNFGVPASQCHVTGFGVDTLFFSPSPASAGSVIASAGMSNRDYQTLVLASEGLGVPVKIAADSEWFPRALNIEVGQLPRHVEARSYGNYANLRQLYSDALFVVVPLNEAYYACGYAVIAEAMAMGKAVIATRTKAPCDFLIDGETGFFVEPKDRFQLRARIIELIENPGRATEVGANARSCIINSCSNERFCENVEEVIKRVLA